MKKKKSIITLIFSEQLSLKEIRANFLENELHCKLQSYHMFFSIFWKQILKSTFFFFFLQEPQFFVITKFFRYSS
jgi:hypothetical protein